ncbi:iron-containing alcohol dehydrogenase family protein [Parolsenella catena]|uniref:iron-containing alcohol dehydrogenase family protein n=1 Tax=Parolsenella catena TaxID=2003188 RepID=UPI002943D16E|nr:iron-containing alcohol dehydrogenase family protein [Parolsenella catena]
MELTSTNYLPSYTVGVDAYKAVPEVTRRFGCTAVIIGGKTAMEKAAPRLLAALEGTGLTVTDQIWYGGQPRHSVAEKLAADLRVQAADMVFGMGGGRAIDETKEIAELAGKPLFTFPTVASNCAPVTAIGVFYKEDGSVDNYFLPKEPPIHSFIDTKVISESPDDYFWAGIGDALSKQPEVELSSRDLDLPHTPLMGRALAVSCERPLFDYSAKALEDKRTRTSSYELEQVILDIIVSTGLVSNMTTNLGAEKGAYYFNSSTAHAFYNAYTGIGEAAERHLHGEVVSFGVLVLKAFDDKPEELKKFAALNVCLGLPTTLSELECPESALAGIVERAQKTNEWGRAPYGFSPERFEQAILDADAYGRALAAGDAAAQAAALSAVRAHRCVEPTPRKL